MHRLLLEQGLFCVPFQKKNHVLFLLSSDDSKGKNSISNETRSVYKLVFALFKLVLHVKVLFQK
jgi:hypothetical protein